MKALAAVPLLLCLAACSSQRPVASKHDINIKVMDCSISYSLTRQFAIPDTVSFIYPRK